MTTSPFPHELLPWLGTVGAWLMFWLLPLTLSVGILYYLLSLPLRRQERARFFLDLIETGLQTGQSVEHTVVSIARSQDTSVGARFHLLAAYVQSGHRLVSALEQVSSLLPPAVVAGLRVGQEIGDLARVLPGCRRLLGDGLSRLRAAVNYQIVMLFVFNPVMLIGLGLFSTQGPPVLNEIYSAFGVRAPAALRFYFDYATWLFSAQWVVLAGLCLGALVYVGGPRLASWLQAGLYPLGDWVGQLLPWRRKRMQRDFSAMLALLLDAEVPEDRALQLAAESTANRVFIRRTETIRQALRQGQPLTEALQQMDNSGELRWRLTNAAHARRGFLPALAGWQEALDAQAFQQEQAAAHFISTLLVILNGTIVALIAVAIMQAINGMAPIHFNWGPGR